MTHNHRGYEALRLTMIREQLQTRRILDERVLKAMAEVPRHFFVEPEYATQAYTDQALPIAAGQTISQPFIVALMAAALRIKPTDRILEIGTGSGYAAAIYSHLAAEVYTVERYRELAITASRRLDELQYDNIWIRAGDGTRGWPQYAPFDAISVAAAAPTAPRSLLAQLADHGRLVLPIGEPDDQVLICITRNGNRFTEESLSPVRFVPLIGAEGWQ